MNAWIHIVFLWNTVLICTLATGLPAQAAEQAKQPVLRGTPMVLGKSLGASVAFATDVKNWQQVKDLGLNTVRVCWVDPWYADRRQAHWTAEEVLPKLDKCVANAQATGLNVIINYHNVGEQQEQKKSGKPLDFSRLASFWRLVAPRYTNQAHCTEWDYPGAADYVKQVDGKLLIPETCESMGVGWIDWRSWGDTKLDRIRNTLIPDAKAKGYWRGSALAPSPRWTLGEGMTTVWPVNTDTRLPHGDFIEQGGLRCGQVVDYRLDGGRRLSMKRGVVWPSLRTVPNDTTGSLIRYYDTNTVLRSWICLPLCMGLMERRAGTIAALFSPRLWTPEGLATQAGDKVFWDRSTLYGFRGVFQAGETATGLRYLEAFTRRRLLGEHAPYPVECGPEGGQAHLSSESALYCRIFTEGLFGILPTGLDRFRCTPRLPDGWPRMALRSIRAFDRTWDLVVERRGASVRVIVEQGGKRVYDRTVARETTVEIVLP